MTKEYSMISVFRMSLPATGVKLLKSTKVPPVTYQTLFIAVTKIQPKPKNWTKSIPIPI